MCISLNDLLPEIHFHGHDRILLTVSLLAGVSLAYGLHLLEHPAEPRAGSLTRASGRTTEGHRHIERPGLTPARRVPRTRRAIRRPAPIGAGPDWGGLPEMRMCPPASHGADEGWSATCGGAVRRKSNFAAAIRAEPRSSESARRAMGMQQWLYHRPESRGDRLSRPPAQRQAPQRHGAISRIAPRVRRLRSPVPAGRSPRPGSSSCSARVRGRRGRIFAA